MCWFFLCRQKYFTHDHSIYLIVTNIDNLSKISESILLLDFLCLCRKSGHYLITVLKYLLNEDRSEIIKQCIKISPDLNTLDFTLKLKIYRIFNTKQVSSLSTECTHIVLSYSFIYFYFFSFVICISMSLQPNPSVWWSAAGVAPPLTPFLSALSKSSSSSTHPTAPSKSCK